ncbi:MAG: sigma 54-interacting transcriptional regulator [Minicystis sp.]
MRDFDSSPDLLDAPRRTVPEVHELVAIPRLELLVETEGGRPSSRRVIQEGEVCRVGSHPSNDLVLDDPRVSRFHCRLSREAGGWRLTDAGSLNGTRLGGLRVLDAYVPLRDCRIELGSSVVRIQEIGSASITDLPSRSSFGSLHGASRVMRRLFALLDRVAQSDATVLIEGESGTGKEVVATEIVQHGPRADGPLVIVDCGAISPSLVESELFGHARGAFTGANRERIGAFQAASGGTVFLDEIGELPLEIQPKLLRALEAREIRRVGETSARKVDVRVIAATNRNLEREVNQRRFREDLYFRLSVVTVRVPPLRDRLEDLGILVDVFLEALGAADTARLFTPEVLADMARYDWPGNVRELRNYVERAVVLQAADPASRPEGSALASTPGAPESRADLDVPFKVAKESVIGTFERAYLSALLSWSGGNVTRAARKAGLDRIHLHRLIQRYGLKEEAWAERPRDDAASRSR